MYLLNWDAERCDDAGRNQLVSPPKNLSSKSQEF